MSPTALRDGELLSIWGDGAGVVRRIVRQLSLLAAISVDAPNFVVA